MNTTVQPVDASALIPTEDPFVDIATIQDGDMLYVPPSQIEVQPGFNPRPVERSPEDQAKLNQSVQAHNVLQSLVVRRHGQDPNRFWLIAGEGRLTAAIATHRPRVPVIFRDVDEAEALAIAKIENSERTDMGAVGEAEAARRMLYICNGDEQEAANRLSMNLSLFRRRILLLNAEPETKRALARNEIKIGHAELLVGLPQRQQLATLKAIIEKGANNVPVAELKARLSKYARNLEEARFDLSGCQGCKHNSAKQSELFDENIGAGKCSNPECFNEKTQQALLDLKQQLSSEYNVVYLDIERPEDSYTILAKTGSNGVGEEQFSACGGCAQFGALIESKVSGGQRRLEGVCFDLNCHKQKVAAFQKAAKAATPPPTRTASTSTGTGSSGGTASAKPKEKRSASEVAQIPKTIELMNEQFLRDVCGDTYRQELRVVKAVCIYALIKDAGVEATKDIEEPDGIRLTANRPDLVPALMALENPVLDRLILDLTKAILTRKERETLNSELTKTCSRILKRLNVELVGRFTLTEKYLSNFTKAGIKALLEEKTDDQSFKDWWESAKERDSFAKLLSEGKNELVKKVLASGYDFSRFVPACIFHSFAKMAGK